MRRTPKNAWYAAILLQFWMAWFTKVNLPCYIVFHWDALEGAVRCITEEIITEFYIPATTCAMISWPIYSKKTFLWFHRRWAPCISYVEIYLVCQRWKPLTHGYTLMLTFKGVQYVQISCDGHSGRPFSFSVRKGAWECRMSVQNYAFCLRMSSLICVINECKVAVRIRNTLPMNRISKRSGYSYWNSTPSLVCYWYCSGNITSNCRRNIRLFRFQ